MSGHTLLLPVGRQTPAADRSPGRRVPRRDGVLPAGRGDDTRVPPEGGLRGREAGRASLDGVATSPVVVLRGAEQFDSRAHLCDHIGDLHPGLGRQLLHGDAAQVRTTRLHQRHQPGLHGGTGCGRRGSVRCSRSVLYIGQTDTLTMSVTNDRVSSIESKNSSFESRIEFNPFIPSDAKWRH